MARFVDLSHDLHDGTVTYPGLPPVRVGTVLSREASRDHYAPGTEFVIGSVELCTNTGTYLDTPFHRYPDGYDLAALELSRCVDLPAVVVDAVVDMTAGTTIGPDSLAGRDVAGCAVLFHTGWSVHWGTDVYLAGGHPHLAAATAEALVRAGAVLVGIDSLNIDDTVGGERPVHSRLLAAGIPIVEHLTNLAELPSAGARFTAVPPKIAGLGTFTVRAFASVPPAGPGDRSRVAEIVFDSADPAALAAFWAEVLGGVAHVRSVDWATVRDPRPAGVLLAFQRVPEGKVTKNRLHLDIESVDLAADAAGLVALGARTVGDVVTDEAGSFQVMLDPEGNEFCLVG